MNIPRNAVMVVLNYVLCDAFTRRATKYLDDHTVVRCTRVGHWAKNGQSVRLWLGRPNYAERKFIKLCKLAGEPFPVKEIQHKGWPSKRR